jgi:hypothetical protein
MNTWKEFAKMLVLVTLAYALVTLLGILFLEGLLGGCDVGECAILIIR